MLSTAAGLDFKQHIILVQPGRRSSAVAVGGDGGAFSSGTVSRFRGCPPFCTCAHGGMRVVWSGMMTSPSCSCLRRTPMPRLAEAWLEVAGQAYERLMPAAVVVAEGPPVGRMLTLNRAPAPLAVQPDHLAEVLRHVEVLVGALMGFRAMRLSGELTPALKRSWKLHASGERSICSPSRRGQPSSMPSRPGLRCARTWKEGVVLSLPSMWMSTLSFSTELQHRRGLWHH